MFQSFVDAINATEVNTVSTVFKLLLSLFLASCVGYERKRKGQSAGVRTFALIAMGATLAMVLSIYVPQEYLGLKNGDPGRIAAQVVTGIGFLGAGAIIQMRGSVRGLTTAAGIWMVAAIGMAVGVGMYGISVLATLLILFVLLPLEALEHRISLGSQSRILRLTLSEIITDLAPYQEVFRRNKVHLSSYYIEYDYAAGTTQLNLVLLVRENVDYTSLLADVREIYPTKAASLGTQTNI